MKKFKFFRFLPVFALLTILFISCTKNGLGKNDAGQGTIIDLGATGSVQARILLNDGTPFPVSMFANNDNFTSEGLYADEDGYISLTNIPAGVYTITVNPVDEGTNTRPRTVIQNITITADQVTDLGTITYDQ